jgi:hypothetical protein
MQEDHMFETSLGYTAKIYLKATMIKKKNKHFQWAQIPVAPRTGAEMIHKHKQNLVLHWRNVWNLKVISSKIHFLPTP